VESAVAVTGRGGSLARPAALPRGSGHPCDLSRVVGFASGRRAAGVGAAQISQWRRCRQVVRDIAWKAQVRLCARYRRLAATGKAKVVVTTAIAREMVGFLWAIARQAQVGAAA
jgi:hypothetical protein